MKIRKLQESNTLQNRCKKHSKNNKGLSSFCTLNKDAGNVEHNVAMFNKMNSSTEMPSVSPNGPMSENLDTEKVSHLFRLHVGDTVNYRGETVTIEDIVNDPEHSEIVPSMLKINGDMVPEENVSLTRDYRLKEDLTTEFIELEYDDLEVVVVTRPRRPRSYDFEYDRDEAQTKEVTIDYEYWVKKSDIVDLLYENITENDFPEIDSATDDEILDFVNQNFDALFEKYESMILDKWRDDAVEEAEMNMNESLERRKLEGFIRGLGKDLREMYYSKTLDKNTCKELTRLKSLYEKYSRAGDISHTRRTVEKVKSTLASCADKKHYQDSISMNESLSDDIRRGNLSYDDSIDAWHAQDGDVEIQLQDRETHTHEFRTAKNQWGRSYIDGQYNKQPKVSSHTWGRVWKGGRLEKQFEGPKYKVRADMAKYLDNPDALEEDWTPPADWVSYKGAWIYPVTDGYEANFMGSHFQASTIDELKKQLQSARIHRNRFSGYAEQDAEFARDIQKFGRELVDSWNPNLVDCPACGDTSFNSRSGRCTKCFYREDLNEGLENCTRYQMEFYLDGDEEKRTDYIYAETREEACSALKSKVGDCQITAAIPEEVPSRYKQWDMNEDVTKEWKPDTSFKHIQDIYRKLQSNGYKYANNERDEFMAAVKKAEAKGYKPDQCRQIKDWHRDIWKHTRKAESLKEANYGGAFDIDPEQYFTRDDLVEFSDEVISYISDRDNVMLDVCELYTEGSNVTIGLSNDSEGFEHKITFRVDMRKIRSPRDLNKYVSSVGNEFLKEYRDIQNESLNESKESYLTKLRKSGYSIKELIDMFETETGFDAQNNPREFSKWAKNLSSIISAKSSKNAYSYKGHTIVDVGSGYRVKDGRNQWVSGEFDTDVDAREHIDSLNESTEGSTSFTSRVEFTLTDENFSDYLQYIQRDQKEFDVVITGKQIDDNFAEITVSGSPNAVSAYRRAYSFDESLEQSYNIKFYQIFQAPSKPTENGKMIGQRASLSAAIDFGEERCGPGKFLIKGVCDDGKVRYVDLKNESKSIKEEVGDNYSNNIEYCPSCGWFLDGGDISYEWDDAVRYTCYNCGNSFDRDKYYNESKSINEGYVDIDWEEVIEWFDWPGCEVENYEDGCKVTDNSNDLIYSIFRNGDSLEFYLIDIPTKKSVYTTADIRELYSATGVIHFIRDNDEYLKDMLDSKLNESRSIKEWNEFSDDDVEDDLTHASVYGGESKYCSVCGAVKEYDEDGFAYCPEC